ncbi:MAG: hypothetical protein KatS3mg038_2897 [Candidatus Kapaibacterium sp.]|nr:MAG: hypothetical protein KatS3mg038_2897 [Candidatus Kapabacteria bacterium]
MAGDWIPVSCDLRRKPEVLQLSQILGLPIQHVVGMLIDFWIWAQEQSVDGRFCNLRLDVIADACYVTPEFLLALEQVGWLNIDSKGLTVPKFERWMGQSAKSRLQARERKRAERSAHTDNPVTQMSRSQRDKNVTPVTQMSRSQRDKNVTPVTQMSRSQRDKNVTTEENRTVQERTGEDSTGEKRAESSATSNVNQTSSGDSSVGCNESKIRGENCGEIGQADSPPAPPKPASELPVVAIPEEIAALEFACQGPQKVWTMDGRTWHALTTAYPAIDVAAEVRKAWCWLAANPSRRKTARGMSRFLANWMARAADAPQALAACATRRQRRISQLGRAA